MVGISTAFSYLLGAVVYQSLFNLMFLVSGNVVRAQAWVKELKSASSESQREIKAIAKCRQQDF